jgi:hypothetical protein
MKLVAFKDFKAGKTFYVARWFIDENGIKGAWPVAPMLVYSKPIRIHPRGLEAGHWAVRNLIYRDYHDCVSSTNIMQFISPLRQLVRCDKQYVFKRRKDAERATRYFLDYHEVHSQEIEQAKKVISYSEEPEVIMAADPVLDDFMKNELPGLIAETGILNKVYNEPEELDEDGFV